MADLGKAYVQIIPSAQGIAGKIKSAISGEAVSAGESAGKTLGTKMLSAFKAAFAAAAVGKIISSSVSEGAKLEQSIGGVETLFKGSANQVRKYASEAFKTVGVSANSYMENVTSFSASLLQSLGGDTGKAANIANMAMMDMGDNANKMGTSMQSIQDAYQGFAKQNYTMLDNLKLGYGGTKSEMERLLASAQKITGVKYDISNLSDVYEAIHVIQNELGITGTTAQEASETLTGSFNAMKASFQDVLGNIAIGENVTQSFRNLAETTSTFVFDNLLPMIGEIFKSLPEGIGAFIDTAMPLFTQKGSELMQNLSTGISTGIKQLATSVPTQFQPIVHGIGTAFNQIPTMFQTLGTTISPVIETIKTGIQGLDFSGVQAVLAAIIPAITSGFQTMMAVVSPAIGTVVESFKNLWNAAQPLIEILASALQPAFEVLGAFLGGVFKGALMAVSTIFDALKVVIEVLTPIIQKLVEGFKAVSPILSSMASAIGTVIGLFGNFGTAGTSLQGLMKSAWDGIKTAFNTAKTLITTGINALKTVFTALGSAGTTLKTGLTAVWNAIKTSITTAGNGIKTIVNTVKNIFNELKKVGDALKNGIKAAWDAMKSAISSAANGIKTVVDGVKAKFDILKNINLSDIGKKIMDGFVNGLKSAWESGKKFIGGIGGWIREHKGPISYDKKLLIPAGKAIMGGLTDGLKDGFKNVQSLIKSMAPEMLKEFKGVSLTDKLNFERKLTPINDMMSEIKSEMNIPLLRSMNRVRMQQNEFDFERDGDNKPVNLTLTIAGKSFKAFVDSISLEQNKQIELEVAY